MSVKMCEYLLPLAQNIYIYSQCKKTNLVQSVDLKTPISGRYVKIKIISEVNNGPWASAAELGIIAK